MTPVIESVRAPAFQLEARTISVRGTERSLRLVRFERGWLASVDTVEGPTLGADHSPHLAAQRALEPLGLSLSEAISIVGPVTARQGGPRRPLSAA